MPTITRKLNKNQVIFNEGDNINFIYLIQSGVVSLQKTGGKGSIEVHSVGKAQVVGEDGLKNGAKYNLTAVCASDCQVIEIPLDILRSQIESSSQMVKILIKSLVEKSQGLLNETRSLRMTMDKTPCPLDLIAKVFGSVYHTARTKGEFSEKGCTVDWKLFRQYAQRVFGESLKRIDNVINILLKLKQAELIIEKNEEDGEDGEEDIQSVVFYNLQGIEDFFEFYQYYYFKGGKTDFLKTDQKVINLAKVFVASVNAENVDRYGNIRIEFSSVVQVCEKFCGYPLNADHLTLLESKGLFVKRQSTDKGVFLQFELAEFERLIEFWKILSEIEKWNERGFVDLKEKEPSMNVKKDGQNTCPSCEASYSGHPKFCSECGHSLLAAA